MALDSVTDGTEQTITANAAHLEIKVDSDAEFVDNTHSDPPLTLVDSLLAAPDSPPIEMDTSDDEDESTLPELIDANGDPQPPRPSSTHTTDEPTSSIWSSHRDDEDPSVPQIAPQYTATLMEESP